MVTRMWSLAIVVGNHLGAGRQRLGNVGVGWGAFLDMRKAVADDDEDEADGDKSGRHDDDHHPPHFADGGGGFRVERAWVGHRMNQSSNHDE